MDIAGQHQSPSSISWEAYLRDNKANEGYRHRHNNNPNNSDL
jgi:hypothetical protein